MGDTKSSSSDKGILGCIGAILAALIVGICGLIAAFPAFTPLFTRSTATPTVVTLTETSQTGTFNPTSVTTATATVLTVPVATNTPVPTPLLPVVPTQTSFVPPTDGMLFQDDFDNGISPQWETTSDNWITNNGKLTISFERYGYFWARLNNPAWQNYHVQMDVDRSAGQVLVAVRNQAIAYWDGFYGHDCWTNKMDMDFYGDCIAGEAKETAREIHLELDVNGNKFTALVDGIEAQTLTSNVSPNGGVAIGIYCQGGFYCPTIDNFKVTYLP